MAQQMEELLPHDFPFEQPEFKANLSSNEMKAFIVYFLKCYSAIGKQHGLNSAVSIQLLKQVLKYSTVLIQHHGLWGGDKVLVPKLREKIKAIRRCVFTNLYPSVIYRYCNVLEKAMKVWEDKETAPKSDLNYQICSQKLRACGICEDLVGYISEFSMRDTRKTYMSETPLKRNGISVHSFWNIDKRGRKIYI